MILAQQAAFCYASALAVGCNLPDSRKKIRMSSAEHRCRFSGRISGAKRKKNDRVWLLLTANQTKPDSL
jgi:hypothetical protein